MMRVRLDKYEKSVCIVSRINFREHAWALGPSCDPTREIISTSTMDEDSTDYWELGTLAFQDDSAGYKDGDCWSGMYNEISI
jgi:hypothetical protein